jgi:hypothetical protein
MLEYLEALPTIQGWYQARDLEPGCILFDQYGKPCRVTSVKREFTPLWKLTTKDGDIIRISDTQKIVNGRQFPAKAIKELSLSHKIKKVKLLDTPHQEVPMDPYVFGLWFFDYNAINSETATISVRKKLLGEATRALNYAGITVVDKRLSVVKKPASVENYRLKTDPPIWNKLNAHYYKKPTVLPDCYLYGSNDQRQRLLDSLFAAYRPAYGMDYPHRHDIWVKFASNEKLNMQIAELAASLGRTVKLVERKGIRHFLLGPMRKHKRNTNIDKIQPIGEGEGVAITVDSKDGSFCVGEGFIALSCH